MLLWKFYRMAWTVHAYADAPAPSWVVHAAKITSLHARLTELAPLMAQALGKQKDVTVDSINRTVNDRIVAKWKQKGVCPWPAGDQFSDPSYQNWTEQKQPVTDRSGLPLYIALCSLHASSIPKSPAKQMCQYVCHQSRMWHIYSTELNVCGERMVN